MELEDFEAQQFLRCNIDAKAVQAVQILKYLSKPSSTSPELFTETEQSCSNTDQCKQEEDMSNADVFETAKNGVLVTVLLFGFQVLETEALDLLAEKTLSQLDKMCRQLAVLADRRKRGRPCAFINPMHQVLHMNNLTIPILHTFYCTRFLNLCNNQLKRLGEIKDSKETPESSTMKLNNRKRKASAVE